MTATSGEVPNRIPFHSRRGSVLTFSPLGNNETTDSSNDCGKHRTRDANRRGAIRGSVILESTRLGWAPRLAAARSSRSSTASMLIERVNGLKDPAREVQLPGTLVARESTVDVRRL